MKKKRKHKGLVTKVLLLVWWLVLEICISLLSLPLFIASPHKQDPLIFNQEGFSYSAFLLRKKVTISASALTTVGIVGYLAFSTFFSYQAIRHAPPVLSAAATWTQTDWSDGIGTNTTTEYNAISNVYASTTGQFVLATTSDWYDDAWVYRHQITIDQNQVSSTLTNFPILVTGDNFGSDFFDNVQQANAAEVVFTSSDGLTKLDREIVSFNSSTSQFEAWVRIPSLVDSADTDIYMYFGNASASESNTTDTWNSNFEVVNHLWDDPAGDGITNSGANTHTFTIEGGAPVSTSSGKIGNAVVFDGTDDSMGTTDANSLDITTSYSLSAWIKRGSTGASSERILNKAGQSNYAFNNYNLALTSSGDGIVESYFYSTTGGFPSAAESTGSINDTEWHHVAAVWDDVANLITVYVDGVRTATGTSDSHTPQTSAQNLYLGAGNNSGANEGFDGTIDEIRVHTTNITQQWIETEYNNQNTPSTFYSVSAVEGAYNSSGTLTSNIFDTQQASLWGSLTFTTDDATSTTVKVRTATTSDMSSATAFASCSGIASGGSIPANDCASHTHRYVQYQVTLQSSGPATTTPTFQDVSIVYEPGPPSNPRTSGSGSSDVTFLWDAGGYPAGTEYYAEITNGASNTSGWITDTSYTFTGLTEGREYLVSVKARNSSGVEGPVTSTVARTLDIGGGSRPQPTQRRGAQGDVLAYVTINNGAAQTDSQDVTLRFNVEHSRQLRVSNSFVFENVPFIDIPQTVSWTLTPGFGSKTVYVQFLGADGGVLEAQAGIDYVGEITIAPPDQSGLIDGSEDGAPGDIAPCSLQPGTVYRTASSTDYEVVTQSCLRQRITSDRVLFSYIEDHDDAVLVDGGDLEALLVDIYDAPMGPRYTPQSGELLKAYNDPKVYLLNEGELQWLVTDRVFLAIGYTWDSIFSVAPVVLEQYTSGEDITMAEVGPYLTDLSFTDSHPDIRELKAFLYSFPQRYYQLRHRTTNFTTTLEESLQWFQRDYQIPETGGLDRKTREVINRLHHQ